MSYITISRENYFSNLTEISKRVRNIDQISVVLKDNAYGHGLVEIAKLAKEFGISRAVVRTVDEAEKIENLFSYILILAPKKVVKRENFFYTINSMADFEKYSSENIELKIDTGMHRLGISVSELDSALEKIREKNFKLSGVFTHFREADVLSTSLFTQRETFKNIKNRVSKFFPNIHFHSNNSAGVFRTEIIEDEIVRVGIASYGYLKGDKALLFPKLKPVLSLFAEKVGELRNAKPNFRVGYGGISKVGNEKLSAYDIGYADGFRRLSDEVITNSLFKTPNGKQPFGKISMDSTIYNSTEPVLEIFNDTSNLSQIFGTIDYEILVALSHQIERRII
ncbi:alanine racemase [Thiovulum sp. ES]|nr:alanine racemase [Thiovulum sp. ES]